jgi:threonine dehydrogenase-like Zn-dependent dehydrogenase
MKALVWTAPGEMVIRDEPEPNPGPEEVLIEVVAAGICGSELGGYLGTNKLRVPPLIMGHEAAGRLVRTSGGSLADGTEAADGLLVTFNPIVHCRECDRCRAGKQNLCRNRKLVGAARPGAFARFVAVPLSLCWPITEKTGPVAGLLAEPVAYAFHTVSSAFLGRGERLLILGAGTIGLFCLKAAKALGVEDVTVTDVSPLRLAMAKAWGATRTVNSREADPLAVLREAVPGGVEAAIDAVGAESTRRQAIAAVVPGGTVIFSGLHEEESPFPANYVVRQEVRVKGSFAYTPPEFGQAVNLLSRGVVTPSPDWLEERPLADGPAAFSELAGGRSRFAKIVLRIDR